MYGELQFVVNKWTEAISIVVHGMIACILNTFLLIDDQLRTLAFLDLFLFSESEILKNDVKVVTFVMLITSLQEMNA